MLIHAPRDTTMKPILVVDDDAGVRSVLRKVIESMGHEVLEAGDSLSALDVLSRGQIGLALCDIRMPGRDGVWLVDQILTRFPSTPVALATGLMEMDPHVTLRQGVVGYVTKPFKRQEIADVIRLAAAAKPSAPPRPFDLETFEVI
jgi:CheY-like chemotaxis protein